MNVVLFSIVDLLDHCPSGYAGVVPLSCKTLINRLVVLVGAMFVA